MYLFFKKRKLMGADPLRSLFNSMIYFSLKQDVQIYMGIYTYTCAFVVYNYMHSKGYVSFPVKLYHAAYYTQTP